MSSLNLGAKWENPILENCFIAHDSSISSISFNHTGKQLASGGDDGVLKIWNFKPKTTRSFIFDDQNGAIKNVRFSIDGSLVASSAGSIVQVRTPKRDPTTWSFRAHTLSVLCVDIAPATDALITCSEDKTIKVWNIENSCCRFRSTLSGHTNWVRSASFSPDGRHILSCGDDATVRIWDVASRVSISSLSYSRFDAALCSTFHPNGWYVAACGKDKHVRIWDVRSKGLLHTFAEHVSAVTSVDFHCGGDFVCSGSLDGTVKLYSLKEGRILYTLHGHESPVHSVQFSKQGDQLGSADKKGQIFLWRTNF